MADNVSVTPGSGVIIGTRDAGGGVEIQRVIPNTWNGSAATDVSSSNPMPTTGTIKDGVTSNLATVAQFHNADNQTPGGTAYGVLTGGVAQLLNVLGNLDRQRETGTDGIPPAGIATGAAQFAMQFTTTDSTDNFAAGTRVFTPVAMSGTIGGVAWSIQVGSVLTIDSAANQEVVLVTAVAATTFTAVTTKSHNGTVTPFIITGFVYNQERDAAGELDGASGAGTAVAAEYLYNSGGPGGSNYDRIRSLQGKGVTTVTVSAGGGAGSTSVTLSAATNLSAGQPLYFLGGTAEVAYVALNYTGGTTVPLKSALINTHANASNVLYDVYSGPIGPALSGFLPTGVGVSEEAIFDPVSGLYYIERAATQDAVAQQNVVLGAPGLWNGTAIDRGRSASAANLAGTSGIGATLIARPGEWSVVHTPATNVQATASKAAGGAGVRHVASTITATLSAGASAIAAAAPLLVNLRDGATGAGTIVWSTYINVPATAAQAININLGGLNIVGSANTAMTLEFAAAGGTNSYESVTLTGYDAS